MSASLPARMTTANPKATCTCINYGKAYRPKMNENFSMWPYFEKMHHFTGFRSKEKRINTIFFTYILLSRYKPPTIGSSWRLSENIPVSCLFFVREAQTITRANVVPSPISNPSAWYIFSSHGAQHTVKLDMPFSPHHVCAAFASFRAMPLPRKTGSM